MSRRGEGEVSGWVEEGVKGSGWWWVPDWGTSGDVWGGRAMHHVSCYQPLFPHLIVKPWIMHGGMADGTKGRGRGGLNLKGALPQWVSLPMNNYTDEPWRKRGIRGMNRWKKIRWGMNGGEKTNKTLKQEKCPWSQAFKHIKHALFPFSTPRHLLFLFI